MERRVYLRNISTSNVTSVSYQPLKREIISGHEDGSLKCWEGDSGELTCTLAHHKGWITDLLFWQEGKVLFSSSLDGTVVQWSHAGVAYNTIELGGPVYSLAWSSRKGQLVAGQRNCIRLLSQAGEVASNGFPLMDRKALHVPGHEDIVKCISCMDNKVISAGYDCKLMIHEVATITGNEGPLKCIFMNPKAHDAGITCLQVTKDTDSSTWMITGSMDKTVKIWTGDGKIVHTLSFSGVVTGVCYVPDVHLVWVVTTSGSIAFFEPKSGSNVSEFVDLLEPHNERRRGSLMTFKGHTFQLLKYIPDTHEVMGTTNRKDLFVWKSSLSASTCVRRTDSHIETITYTCKSPLLLFMGSFDGSMHKWERLQLNPFDFQQEELGYKKKPPAHLGSADEKVAKHKQGGQTGFLKSLFVESLDLLVATSMDGKIFVWGYDKAVVKVLTSMQSNGAEAHVTGDAESDAVTNRVAGFACLHVLDNHTGCVTGLALVESSENGKATSGPYLLSSGWDLTICLWDLNTARLVARLEGCLSGGGATDRKGEEAGDEIVTDLAYCSKHGLFAYSSSNKITYLRKFALQQSKMELVSTLVGHTGEVTQVRWNQFCDRWVTSSEDSTIRVWSIDGSQCEQMVTVEGPVSVLAVDSTNGCILAATQTVIRLLDTVLQPLATYRGHTDLIRMITHVPEWNQYISSSWDSTVRIWACYHLRKHTDQGIEGMK